MPAGVKAGNVLWEFDSWYPDSTRFVADLIVPGKPMSLWSVPILGGAPQELIETEHLAWQPAMVSPDGSHIAYFMAPGTYGTREIWLMGPHGESPHKMLTAADNSGFYRMAWSPAGNRIAIARWHREGKKTTTSVESWDLSGASKTTILPDESRFGGALRWTPGELVYSRGTQNLWELNIDDETGMPKGNPQQLTDWSGFMINGLSATADGKHLAIERGNRHAAVFVGDLADKGDRLLHARRLTIDDYWNVPFAWTSDSRSVIFGSIRLGYPRIYKQALDSGAPQAITSSYDFDDWAGLHLTPDGEWVLFAGVPPNSPPGSGYRFFRVPVNGGPTQALFDAPEMPDTFFCTNRAANYCAYPSLAENGRSWVITAFDPGGGKRRELLRIPTPEGDDQWGLSPDGAQVAIFKTDWATGQIRFIPVAGGEARTVTVKGYVNLNSIVWAQDSKSMFIGISGSAGATLLHVDLNGNARPIWQQPYPGQGDYGTWGIPSPDARHLAVLGQSAEANVWMIDNF